MLKMLKEKFCPVDRPSSPTEIYKIHNNETQKTNDYVNKYIFFHQFQVTILMPKC